MIAVNTIAIDLIPYSLRTVFHSREYKIKITSSSVLALILLVVDFCEIWYKGGRSEIFEVEAKSMDNINQVSDQGHQEEP
jgi:hypothetical protein